ncbi:response regulator [Methylotenera versatilis]|uniref:response regulator n=1 Tax=Methylotenera versatilis TaxID=1055487 RepID=UPI00068A742A|nr:response regulator [Methylotenera versatilis]
MSTDIAPISDSFVTTRVAAKMLNVSLRTIQLWVESGILNAWKTAGGHRKVSVISIEAVLLSRQEALKTSEVKNHSDEKFNILLVEDDEGLRQLFRFYFTDWKYDVELDLVNNGFDGLISLGSKVPDLLVTDLNMPGINGFELLRHLGKSPQFSELDVIVITALAPEDFIDNAVITPNIKVFFKPIDFDAFEAYILPIIAKKIGA